MKAILLFLILYLPVFGQTYDYTHDRVTEMIVV